MFPHLSLLSSPSSATFFPQAAHGAGNRACDQSQFICCCFCPSFLLKRKTHSPLLLQCGIPAIGASYQWTSTRTSPLHRPHSSQQQTPPAWASLRVMAFFRPYSSIGSSLGRRQISAPPFICEGCYGLSLPSHHWTSGNACSGVPPPLLSHWPWCLHQADTLKQS